MPVPVSTMNTFPTFAEGKYTCSHLALYRTVLYEIVSRIATCCLSLLSHCFFITAQLIDISFMLCYNLIFVSPRPLVSFPCPSPRSPGSSYWHIVFKNQDMGAKFAVEFQTISATELERIYTNIRSSFSSPSIKKPGVHTNNSLPTSCSWFIPAFFLFVTFCL